MIKGKTNTVMISDRKLLACARHGSEHDPANDVIRGVYKY